MSTPAGIAYCYKFDDVELNEVLRTLNVRGELVELEPRPLAVLLALVRRPGETLTREELLAELWQGRVTVPNVVANAIGKLREALGPQRASRIVTIPKVGYRFDGTLIRQVLGRPKPDIDADHLTAGRPVPGRSSSYILQAQLGSVTRHSVWRAQHTSLPETRIFKFAFNGDQLASLKRELTITRYLTQHLGEREDITYITDTNFSEPPFFIEYPDFGIDLAQWVKTDDQWKEMTLGNRLNLFIRIAQAVSDAHLIGVFHKDIKPSNVLLKKQNDCLQVRLADFGSGRFSDYIDRSNLDFPVMGMTVTDVHVGAGAEGTWIYMAPEVLRGEPFTSAADVYALGLMLFQFVCGDFDRTLTSDWRKAVNDPELEADIEAATAADPKHRTISAAQLMESVATLEGRRQARLVAEHEAKREAEDKLRAERWAARQPWIRASAGLLIVAAASATGLSYQLNKALNQAQAAKRNSDAMAEFLLTDVFRSADLTRAEAGAIPAAGLKSVLLSASKKAGERFAGQPELEAVIRSRLAEALARSESLEATQEFERAFKLFEAGSVRNQRVEVQAKLSYANLLADTGQHAQARKLIDELDPFFQSVNLEADPLIWAWKYSAEIAIAHAQLNPKEELRYARLYKQTLDTLPNVSISERHSALTLLADALARAGHEREAKDLFEQATTAPFLPEAVGAHAWSFTKGRQALLAIQFGRLDEAQDLLESARVVYRQLPEPTYALTWDMLMAQAYIDELKGRLHEASRAYAEGAQIAAKAFGHNSPLTASASSNAAAMASYLDNPAAALPQLDAEIARSKSMHAANGDSAGPLAVSLLEFHRAVALTRLGKSAEALRILDRLDSEALSKEDSASGWDARLKAERTRARMVLHNTPSLRSEMATHVEALQTAKAPEWVISRYKQWVK